MDSDEHEAGRRQLLSRAVEHGTVMNSMVARLAGSSPGDDSAWLATASRAELDQLHVVASSGDVSARACGSALAHLQRLQGVLALSLASSARSASVIADRLALVEELGPGQVTSCRAAALADELAEHGRALACA